MAQFFQDADSRRVALVNETFAKPYFAGGLAVGHRIGLGSDPGTPTDTQIVGVINNTRYESLRQSSAAGHPLHAAVAPRTPSPSIYAPVSIPRLIQLRS